MRSEIEELRAENQRLKARVRRLEEFVEGQSHASGLTGYCAKQALTNDQYDDGRGYY